MLQFFRRHQKIFFIVVTFVVVVSFCFFGTYGTMDQQSVVPDHELGKGVNGKSIKSKEFASLCHLLESSALDRFSKDSLPNFFNPGVIEKEFLSNGLGLLLVKPYFAAFKKDLDDRVKKIHHFRPYVHPHSSELSAEWLWGIFSAPLMQRYPVLKSRSDQATVESFALMSQLYVDQLALPPVASLKQILMMQQNQLGVESDPLLEQTDLSLFGFKSLEDWFGPKFVPLVTGFILNAAQVAEEKGYEISTEQVRQSLFQNIYHWYQAASRNEKLKPEEANQYYLAKMRSLGFDEKTLLHAWRKVLLFQRLFEEVGSSVLIDPLVYEQFDQFAAESVEVDLYQIPKSLQFSDFLSMLKFQLYIEGVSQEGVALRKSGALPTALASLEQIEKKNPQFVESPVDLEWKMVTKAELESRISVKETWSWELADGGWSILRKTFPSLLNQVAQEPSQRIALLSRLSEEDRSRVDAFAREQILSASPDLLTQALETSVLKTASLGLRTGADFLSVLGIQENPELLSLLKNASLKGEELNDAAKRLQCYSSDQSHFYTIEVVGRQENKKILTFAQASKDGTLDRLLHQVLEKGYLDVRKKHASEFQSADGEWKPLEQVKEQVGKYLFADLLKTLEEGYCAKRGALPSSNPLLSFYSDSRFFSVMDELKQRISNSQDSIPSLLPTSGVTPFNQEWVLEKETTQLTRSSPTFLSKEELFSLNQDQWSSVQMGKRGVLGFYLVKGKGKVTAPPLESVDQGHQILSQDAKRDLMIQLMQKIHKEKGLDLLSYFKEESQ